MVRRWALVVLALVLVGLSALLSWPVEREPTYWALSPEAWAVYVVLAVALATYILVEFLQSLSLLSRHARVHEDASDSRDG